MDNPWLSVRLEDYEGHMSAPDVGQLSVLSDLFGEAVARCRPGSVAILGVAGGNGLDRIDTAVTARIVGVDLNPNYLEAVGRRYANLPGLELHSVDLAARVDAIEPVALSTPRSSSNTRAPASA